MYQVIKNVYTPGPDFKFPAMMTMENSGTFLMYGFRIIVPAFPMYCLLDSKLACTLES